MTRVRIPSGTPILSTTYKQIEMLTELDSQNISKKSQSKLLEFGFAAHKLPAKHSIRPAIDLDVRLDVKLLGSNPLFTPEMITFGGFLPPSQRKDDQT